MVTKEETLLIIQEEVNRQLSPIFKRLIKIEEGQVRIDKWKLALWSNGSGGPKGWIEVFAEQTNDKLAELVRMVTELKDDRIARDSAEEEKSIIEGNAKERAKERREIVIMWLQVVGGIIALLMFVLGFGGFVWQVTHTQSIDPRPPQVINSEPTPMNSLSPGNSQTPTIIHPVKH